jgi:hypothetical protein
MTTLRIEHAISDYDLWQQAFDSFAQARAKAGVRGFVIRQPADDPKYLSLDPEFDTGGRLGRSPGSCRTGSGPLRRHRPRSLAVRRPRS